jgi:hypothetical protein
MVQSVQSRPRQHRVLILPKESGRVAQGFASPNLAHITLFEIWEKTSASDSSLILP